MTNKQAMIERAEKLNEILERRGDGFTVFYYSTFKNNAIYQGYVLDSKNRNSSPIIYQPEEWWHLEDEELVDFLYDFYKKHNTDVNLETMISKDYVQENVIPVLFSSENIPELKSRNIVYKEFLDLVIILQVNTSISENKASFMITEGCMEYLELDFDELYKKALFNMEQEVVLSPLSDTMKEIMGDAYPDELSEIDRLLFPPLWVVTNKEKHRGAAVMLSENIREKIRIALEGDFVVLPSSIHEIIVVRRDENTSFSDLLEMVIDINQTELEVEDKLTNNLYFIENGNLKSFI